MIGCAGDSDIDTGGVARCQIAVTNASGGLDNDGGRCVFHREQGRNHRAGADMGDTGGAQGDTFICARCGGGQGCSPTGAYGAGNDPIGGIIAAADWETFLAIDDGFVGPIPIITVFIAILAPIAGRARKNLGHAMGTGFVRGFVSLGTITA